MSAQSPVAEVSLSGLELPTYSISSDTPEGALAILLNELSRQAKTAIGPSASGSAASNYTLAIPTDPLLSKQWYLINTGQSVGNPDFQAIYGTPGEDINVAPVWAQGLDGTGIKVVVIDEGTQTTHPDLAGNIDSSLLFDPFDFGTDADPVGAGAAHGTAVAGIIGALASNPIGGAGIAPGVDLGAVRLIDRITLDPTDTVSQNAIANSFRFAIINDVDITNNSWGLNPTGLRELSAPSETVLKALRDSVIFGRDGKGLINIFASGNSGGPSFTNGFPQGGALDSANYNGYGNSRYVITVTGVDHDGSYNNIDGSITSYPEAGANVLVAAPTGSVPIEIGRDTGIGSGIVTTDLVGEAGYNRSPNPLNGDQEDNDYLADINYTSRFNGTSASAPMVSGVVALMLQANSNLTWRDVQEILVRSARQNDQFGVPTIGAGVRTQNTWIVNNSPFFQNPDPYFLGINPQEAVYNPIATPDIQKVTTGAGYTVSQGRGVYGEEIGYGHGVVDAQLAVQLAQQWTTKNQMLPAEKTFTTYVLPPGTSGPGNNTFIPIPAREIGNDDSGRIMVPGRLGGESGFIEYWNEYFADEPDFGQDFSAPGSFIQITTPPAANMSVEWAEMSLNITGGAASAMDFLRIALVAPDGTVSELNPYFTESGFTASFQGRTASQFTALAGQSADSGDELNWTFSTNRNWGSRLDNAIMYDPSTGEPTQLDSTGNNRGWRVYMENWGTTPLQLNDLEITWHGSEIAANTKRISGFVGVDQVRDDSFNFSRINVTTGGSGNRFFDAVSTIDQSQEPFASNVTVTLRNTTTGAIVDRFVTGADGNYYFDVVPGDYIVSVEDPLNRTALDDTTQTPAGFVKEYQNQWRITPDWFNAWEKFDVNGELKAAVDSNGVPIPFQQGGAALPDHVRDINFLLTPAKAEATFNGRVYADLDGNGAYNSGDTALPSIVVYADADNDGVQDPTEPSVSTDSNGNYSLIVPLATQSIVNVRAVAPSGWTFTEPVSGVQTQFAQLGQTISSVNFGLKPPVGGGGSGSGNGYILGAVFDDANGDGVRQSTESGLPGFRIYIDANSSGGFDPGEIETTSNATGGYAFTNIAPGTKQVRVEVIAPFTQTLPSNNGPRVVNLAAGATVSGVLFGLRNVATFDYGDLPPEYAITTLAENGARHKKGVYFLGATIDAESTAYPSADARGDDTHGLADEDGVQIVSLPVGGTGTIVVTASRNNGYLKAWIDWNDNKVFDADERITFTANRPSGVVTTNNMLLDAGANTLTFTVPANAVAQPFARFRFGSFTTNSFLGEDVVGEVEDYRLAVSGIPVSVPLVAGIPADFDQDGDVDGADILLWQRNLGMSHGATQSHGSADADGDVDLGDLSLWRQEFGATASAALYAESPDFNSDGSVDGFDLLAWQRGLGSFPASLVMGDGNRDGQVSSADLSLWRQSFGLGSAGSGSTSALFANEEIQTASISAEAGSSAGEDVDVRMLSLTDSTPATATTRSARSGYRPSLVSNHQVGGGSLAGDLGTDHRDRAFDEIFSARKRQVDQAATDGAASDEADCDAAFALFAEYGQW